MYFIDIPMFDKNFLLKCKLMKIKYNESYSISDDYSFITIVKGFDSIPCNIIDENGDIIDSVTLSQACYSLADMTNEAGMDAVYFPNILTRINDGEIYLCRYIPLFSDNSNISKSGYHYIYTFRFCSKDT